MYVKNVDDSAGIHDKQKSSTADNRFLNKEHGWKEEKNVRRDGKECESRIINLH